MESKSENVRAGPNDQNGDIPLVKARPDNAESSPSVSHGVEIDNFESPRNGHLPEAGNDKPQQSYNGQPRPLARVSTTASIENTNGQRSSQESAPEVAKFMNQRGRSFSTKQPESPSSRMTPAVQDKWWKVINTLLRKRRVSCVVLESFSKAAGSPCERCASMKLTEAKFIISEFSKHTRIAKAVDGRSDLAANDSLGPEGLEFGPHEFKLGALHDLYSRPKCPFCSLATSSLIYQCETFVGHAPDGKERSKDQFYQQNVICFASWQIDGRILIRVKDKIIGSRACTRRIRLRWTPGSDFSSTLYTTYVVLMAPRNAEKGLFLGRTMDVTKADAALIQRWIGFCESSHGDKCRPQTQDVSLSKSFFGVIDVKEMCLTKLPDKERYIALSYTWGKNIAPFETKKKSVRALMKSGALRSHFYDIPRTIRDAIKLVTDLGERYLWVDALCIIQDSERSWALNSRVMDVVYGNAYFTICAADGENANAGLRALHNPGHSQTIKQYNRDIRLMCTQPAENFIQHSEWNKRGWTFQERLLSARNLIFTAGRMYFQCRCTARSVDIQSEDESMGWSIEFKDSPLLMLQKLSSRPLSVYKQALGLYMKRELTHSKDILAAFTGIGNLVCGALGGSLVYGLPSSHFDWALLWEPRDAAIRRKDVGSERFPSWSWCGWKDQIMEYKEQRLSGCEDNLHDWLMNHTWITWYIRDGNGNLRLVWNGDCGNMASSKVDSTSRGYCKPDRMDEETHDSYGRFIPAYERKYRRCKDFKQILDECPYDVDFIETIDNQSQNSTEKDMPYLQFYTWAAFFRIQEDRRFSHDASFGKNFRRYSILDYKDDWCGTILLEKFWVRERNLKMNLEGHPDRNQEELLEFIAISDAKRFDDEEYNDWANYIPVDRMESTWDLYYVLLVEYKDDIAYRVGLGKVFKEAFENSCKPEGKQWKEFILG